MAARTRAPQTAEQTTMLKTGMHIQPRHLITPGMAHRWKFARESTPIFGCLRPGDKLRIVRVHGLGANNGMVGVAGARNLSAGAKSIIDIPGRPAGYVIAKQMNGSTQLKLSGPECLKYFEALA